MNPFGGQWEMVVRCAFWWGSAELRETSSSCQTTEAPSNDEVTSLDRNQGYISANETLEYLEYL